MQGGRPAAEWAVGDPVLGPRLLAEGASPGGSTAGKGSSPFLSTELPQGDTGTSLSPVLP